MPRFALLNQPFFESVTVYSDDGYTKVSGLKQANGDFQALLKLNGENVSPAATIQIDEPDNDGVYRVVIPSAITVAGYYLLQITVPTYEQTFEVGIEAQNASLQIQQTLERPVTIVVTDANAAPLGDCAVQVLDATAASLVQAGRTSQSNGKMVTTLDPGSYEVYLSRPLTTFANPYSLVVTSDVSMQTFPLAGENIVVAAPTAANVCRVYGYLQSMTGKFSDRYNVYIESVGSGTASYVPGPGAINPKSIGIANDSKTVRPDRTTGIWQVDLVRGNPVRIRIDEQGVDMTFIVPNQPSINLRDVTPTKGVKLVHGANAIVQRG